MTIFKSFYGVLDRVKNLEKELLQGMPQWYLDMVDEVEEGTRDEQDLATFYDAARKEI